MIRTTAMISSNATAAGAQPPRSPVRNFRLIKGFSREEKDVRRLESRGEKVKVMLWKFLENPDSGKWASRWSWFMIFVIVVSCGTFILSTSPTLDEYIPTLFIVEIVTIVVFSMEHVARLSTTPSIKKFYDHSVMNRIDLLSIIPFFIDLMVKSLVPDTPKVLGMIRIFRFFRLFRLSKKSKSFMVLMVALRRASKAILLGVLTLTGVVVLFSSLIYFGEMMHSTWHEQAGSQGAWFRDGESKPSPFQSVFHAMWWCIATITTVGYGDDVPIAEPAKAAAMLAQLVGMMVISIPIALIGHIFQETWEAYEVLEDYFADVGLVPSYRVVLFYLQHDTLRGYDAGNDDGFKIAALATTVPKFEPGMPRPSTLRASQLPKFLELTKVDVPAIEPTETGILEAVDRTYATLIKETERLLVHSTRMQLSLDHALDTAEDPAGLKKKGSSSVHLSPNMAGTSSGKRLKSRRKEGPSSKSPSPDNDLDFGDTPSTTLELQKRSTTDMMSFGGGMDTDED
eukprot:GFYU01008159.1.p1 GENE.GFYU01008159.1~~GFYU01008159.1.p1  ORF type:complete len:512 (-),score=72.82 GFYU01008159.1:1160-2695(-)